MRQMADSLCEMRTKQAWPCVPGVYGEERERQETNGVRQIRTRSKSGIGIQVILVIIHIPWGRDGFDATTRSSLKGCALTMSPRRSWSSVMKRVIPGMCFCL